MGNLLPAAVGAVVSDVLSVCGVPGASTLGMTFSAAVEGVMARRRDNAREILLGELCKGEAFVDQAASIDEWVAVLLRYSRAALEGTARLNLRLMAKVMAAQAQTGPLVRMSSWLGLMCWRRCGGKKSFLLRRYMLKNSLSGAILRPTRLTWKGCGGVSVLG